MPETSWGIRGGRPGSSVASPPDMRVEIREPGGSDVRASIDPDLPPGEVRRDGDELRVGAPERARRRRPPHGGRPRGALAPRRRAARSRGARRLERRRRAGARASSRARPSAPTTPASSSAATRDRPRADARARRARRAAASSLERQATIARHLDAARDLANRPPNDLTPVALAAACARASPAPPDRRVATAATGSRSRAWARSPPSRAGAREEPQLIVMRYDPPGAPRRRHARTRRQGDHVRLGRHLAQAAAAHAGHEGRHVRRRRSDRGDRRDRRARPARARPHRRRVDRERAGRQARTGPATSSAPSNGKTIEIINTDAEGRLHPRRRAALRARERRDARRSTSRR